jgi:hypothetical protein
MVIFENSHKPENYGSELVQEKLTGEPIWKKEKK